MPLWDSADTYFSSYYRHQLYLPPVSGSFNPLTQITWTHAVWAGDPSWTNPGDGNAVSSWRNTSGGGNPAQGTGANQPIYRASVAALNNKPAVQFDGTNDLLDVDVTDLPQAFTMVAVFIDSTGADATARSIIGTGETNVTRLGKTSANVWTINDNTGTSVNGGTPNTSAHVMHAVVNGASSELFLDGTSLATGTCGTGQIRRFVLGACTDSAGANAARWMSGYIAFAGITTASLGTLITDLKSHYAIP